MLSSLVYIGEILNIDFIHTGACITECESSNPSIICYGGLLEPHRANAGNASWKGI